MATKEQIAAALFKADKAGNVEDAKILAKAYRELEAQESNKTQLPPPNTPKADLMEQGKQLARDVVGGAIRGAGSIGATALAPVDYVVDAIKGDRDKNLSSVITGKQPISRNEERRQQIDEGLNSLIGSNPESIPYQVGKVGAEIAGTMGTGNVLAKGIPIAAPLLKAGGLGAGHWLAKPVAGAAVGATSAGMINPKDAYKGAIGGAILPLLGSGYDKLLPKVSEEIKDLALRAKAHGIDVPLDRLYNSKTLDNIAGALNYIPGSGRQTTEKVLNAQVNKRASNLIGEDTANMVKALRDAKIKLGDKFNETLKTTNVVMDAPFKNSIARIQEDASRILGSSSYNIIKNQIDDLVDKGSKGFIDGDAAYSLKQKLDIISGRNSPEAYHAKELKKSLFAAMDRSLGTKKADEFRKVREQYGNVMELGKLAKNGAEGELSISRVGNIKSPNDPKLQELADIAAQFIKPRVTDHSSKQNVLFTSLGLGLSPTIVVPALARGANMALKSQTLKNKALGVTTNPSKKMQFITKYLQKAIPAISTEVE